MKEFQKWLDDCPVSHTQHYLKQYDADWTTIYFEIKEEE